MPERRYTMGREKVIDSFSMIVEGGAGKEQWFLDTTEQLIQEAALPDSICYQADVNNGIFTQSRTFLLVGNETIRDYHMFISARDYGAHLYVSWFVTIAPGFFKRTVSKYATGNPQALSASIDVFRQQDLHAFTTVAHHVVKRVIELLLEELKQDPSEIRSARSKGFLNVW